MFARIIQKSYQSVPRRFFCQARPGESNEELKTRILKTALIHVNRAGIRSTSISIFYFFQDGQIKLLLKLVWILDILP